MHKSVFNPSPRMLRQFASIWILFFGAMAAWQDLYHQRHLTATILAVAAVTIGPIGVVSPRAIKPVFVGWTALVYPIGWLVSRTVLTVVFYGLFTPVAAIFRIIGRDELKLKPRSETQTYWCAKPQARNKAQYLRQF